MAWLPPDLTAAQIMANAGNEAFTGVMHTPSGEWQVDAQTGRVLGGDFTHNGTAYQLLSAAGVPEIWAKDGSNTMPEGFALPTGTNMLSFNDAQQRIAASSKPDFIDKVAPAAIMALAMMAGMPGAVGSEFLGQGGNLAALIESGTVGTAGAGLEAAAGISSLGPAAAASGFAPDAISEMINAVNSTGAATATEAAAQLGFPSIEAYLQGINPSWITPGFNVNIPGGGLPPSEPSFLQQLLSSFSGGGAPGAEAPLVGDLMPNINAQAMAELAGGPGAFGNISMPGLTGGAAGMAGAGLEEELWKKLMKQAMGVGGGPLGMIANIGSGLLGLNKAKDIQSTAAQVAAANDPFGPYRPQYAQQLSALSANPNLITSTPGYQFGIDQGNQALMRTMAARGYTGSGNEMIALQRFNQDYAGRYLAAEQERLARLAGAGISGNSNALLTGEQLSTDLMSKALASIGYGLKGW